LFAPPLLEEIDSVIMSLNQGTNVQFESNIVRPQQSLAKPHAPSPLVSRKIQPRTKIEHDMSGKQWPKS
jgi:hypothetical protein